MDPWIIKRKLVTGGTENMQLQQNVSTQEFILKIKFDKDQNNKSKEMKRILVVLIQKKDGHIIFLPPPVVLLHHPGGDHPTAGGQHGIGTLDHGLSNRFVCSSRREDFRLQEIAIPVQVMGGVHRILCRTHFVMRTVCQRVLSGGHPSPTFHAFAWFKMKQCAFFQNCSYFAQHVVHCT